MAAGQPPPEGPGGPPQLPGPVSWLVAIIDKGTAALQELKIVWVIPVIAAAAAIANLAFGGDKLSALISVVAGLVIIFVFAIAAKASKSDDWRALGKFLMWSFALLFVAWLVLLTTCAVAKWPVPLRDIGGGGISSSDEPANLLAFVVTKTDSGYTFAITNTSASTDAVEVSYQMNLRALEHDTLLAVRSAQTPRLKANATFGPFDFSERTANWAAIASTKDTIFGTASIHCKQCGRGIGFLILISLERDTSYAKYASAREIADALQVADRVRNPLYVQADTERQLAELVSAAKGYDEPIDDHEYGPYIQTDKAAGWRDTAAGSTGSDPHLSPL